MYANDGSGFVMMRSALFPAVIEPERWLTPIAYAVLMVQALNASSGVSLILMHPRAMTNLMSPDGEDPGLKSDANARARPARMNSLALP